jgi:NTP pyrophosphatase (non-canonical NTP hydrolase)
MPKPTRPKVDPKCLQAVYDLLDQRLKKKMEKHKGDSYASRAEIYGLLSEEVYELLKAMHENDGKNFKDELLDIALICVFGHASIDVVYEE